MGLAAQAWLRMLTSSLLGLSRGVDGLGSAARTSVIAYTKNHGADCCKGLDPARCRRLHEPRVAAALRRRSGSAGIRRPRACL